MGTVDINVKVPSSIKPHPSVKSYIKRFKRAANTNLYSNAWKLIYSEIEKLNVLFSFSLEACCDPKGKNKYGPLPFYSQNDSFLPYEVVGRSVFCNPPFSLAIQCVEYLRMCHSKAPTDTKAVTVYLNGLDLNL